MCFRRSLPYWKYQLLQSYCKSKRRKKSCYNWNTFRASANRLTEFIRCRPPLYRVIFSDEAHFDIGGYVNQQYCHIWGTENPHAYIERSTHPKQIILLWRLIVRFIRICDFLLYGFCHFYRISAVAVGFCKMDEFIRSSIYMENANETLNMPF